MNDAYDIDAYESQVGLPRKRKRDEGKVRRRILTFVIVLLVVVLAILSILLIIDVGEPTSSVDTSAYMNTIHLPAYRFDAETIATETSQFIEAFPEMHNWHRHESLDVSLWLPPKYALYNLQIGIDRALSGAERLGDEADYYAELLRRYPDMYRFIAVSGTGSVTVTRENPLIHPTLDQYMTMTERMLPQGATLVGYDIIQLQGVNVVRYQLDQTIGGKNMTVIGYVVADGDFVYIVNFGGFSSIVNEEDIPDFDQIMQTFRVSRTD